MARFAGVVKVILVVGLVVLGSLSLLKGLGVAIPLVKYDKVEARDIPAGVVLLGAAIALVRFWLIKKGGEEALEVPGQAPTKVKTDEQVHFDN